MNQQQSTPIQFDEFFDSGLEESVSPFLTSGSRKWAQHIPLKAALASAGLLGLAFGLSFVQGAQSLSWLLLALVYFFAGVPKLIDAVDDLLNLEINIDVLMTLAAFLSILIGSAMEGGLLLVLFAVSGSMEKSVTSKAKGAVRALHQLAPSTVALVDETGTHRIRNVRDVQKGNKILVKSGEVIPLDGIVASGASSINLTHLTGESTPIQAVVGDQIPAGATNMEGALTIEVTCTSSDSTLSRIIKLVTQAQEARPKFQRWLDRVSRGYAISIIGLSFAFALILPWVSSLPYLGDEGSIYRALAFLIAASPCALIIALPVAYLSAVSGCARSGILLKGGITLDALASCSTIAFDKTGTLTTGQLRCIGLEPVGSTGNHGLDETVAASAALEQNAVHPIANAILAYYNQMPPSVEDFRAIAGYGVMGKVGGINTYVGHASYIESQLSDELRDQLQTATAKIRNAGQLLSVVLRGEALYLFRFEDAPRPGVKGVLTQLRDQAGLHLLMLTGDHQANAAQVAQRVGLDEFHADLRPEDKLEHVTKLAQKQGLAMVGDGINDAPALARATVGISMGTVGSHTAVEASDVVLLHDNLNLLPWLWKKAKRTVVVVKQNVVLALLAIVGASISALLGWVPLWLAVILHEGGTVLVGLNSLRLLRSNVRQKSA